MVRDIAYRLAECLSRRTGNGLRTVVIVADDGYELEYIRDDLSERYTGQTLTAAVTDLQVETSFPSPSSDSSPVGERRMVVYCYESVFVPQLPFSETEQIITSIGTGSGTDFLRFVEDCRRIIDQEN